MKNFYTKLLTIGVLAALFVTTTTTSLAASFSDVSSSHQFNAGIDLLSSSGIVQGYSDGTYQPERTINRAEMLKILFEAEIILNGGDDSYLEDYANQTCFNDVPGGEWFTKYVCSAKAFGYVQGYDGNVFRPAQEVNFVEALKMSLEVLGIGYIANEEPWYKGPVDTGASGNYIPQSITSFDAKLSRGEMADLIGRVITERDGTQAEYLGDLKNSRVTFDSIKNGTAPESIMVDSDSETNDSNSDSSSSPAAYVDYYDGILDNLEDGKTYVLDFHADWCPTCIALANQLSDPAQLATLPDNVVIIKANYDTEKDLKQQFEVLVQHTLIQLDSSGTEVTRWVGGGIETIQANLEL